MNDVLSSAERRASCAPAGLHPSSLGEVVTVAVVGKSVQRMALQELRDELYRTRPAWEAEVGDLEGVLTDGQRPALGQEARRHQLVASELLRRPNSG